MSDEERDIAEGTWYNARRRIVNRTRHAFRDFRVVYEYMNDTDREKVFYTPSDAASPPFAVTGEPTTRPSTEWIRRIGDAEDLHVGRGAWCALAFIYEGVGEEEFNQMLTRALAYVLTGTRTVGTTGPRRAGLDVSLVVEHTDTAMPLEVGRKVEYHEPDEFTNAELTALHHIVGKTDGTIPETRDEFLEKYYDFMAEQHPDIDPDSGHVVFTTEPFDVVEQPAEKQSEE